MQELEQQRAVETERQRRAEEDVKRAREAAAAARRDAEDIRRKAAEELLRRETAAKIELDRLARDAKQRAAERTIATKELQRDEKTRSHDSARRQAELHATRARDDAVRAAEDNWVRWQAVEAAKKAEAEVAAKQLVEARRAAALQEQELAGKREAEALAEAERRRLQGSASPDGSSADLTGSWAMMDSSVMTSMNSSAEELRRKANEEETLRAREAHAKHAGDQWEKWQAEEARRREEAAAKRRAKREALLSPEEREQRRLAVELEKRAEAEVREAEEASKRAIEEAQRLEDLVRRAEEERRAAEEQRQDAAALAHKARLAAAQHSEQQWQRWKEREEQTRVAAAAARTVATSQLPTSPSDGTASAAAFNDEAGLVRTASAMLAPPAVEPEPLNATSLPNDFDDDEAEVALLEVTQEDNLEVAQLTREEALPILHGGAQKTLFPGRECFLITRSEKDTQQFALVNMETGVELVFTASVTAGSKVRALALEHALKSKYNTVTMQLDGNGSGKVTAVVVPGSCVYLFEGTIRGFSVSCTLRPVSLETRAAVKADRDERIAVEQLAAEKLGAGLDDEGRLAKCVASKTLFVDPMFPPTASSLVREKDVDRIPPTPWSRPSWYLRGHKQPRLFVKSIEPQDVDQGELGDCYLCCTLASLAEKPRWVQSIFAHPQFGLAHADIYDRKGGRHVTETGKHQARERRTATGALQVDEMSLGGFRVNINVSGWWQSVVVDEFLPAVMEPIFAKDRTQLREIWASIAEKAYAKVHGSYAALIGGSDAQALRDFTGFPTTSIMSYFADDASRAALFDKLVDWDRRDFCITLLCPVESKLPAMCPAKTAKEVADMGLACGHAFSLLRAIEVAGERLVQIRNPWGNATEWKGAWSDTDPRWKSTPVVAKACTFSPAPDDGTFWMSWADAVRFFTDGTVCHTLKGWFDYRVRCPLVPTPRADGASLALAVYVESPLQLVLTLSQATASRTPAAFRTTNGAGTLPLVALQLCLAEPVRRFKATAAGGRRLSSATAAGAAPGAAYSASSDADVAEYRVVQCSTGDYETVSATGAFVATPAVAMTCRLKVCAKDVQSRTAAPYLIFPASALI